MPMMPDEKGNFKPVWYDVPTGKCWSNGIPSIDGKCIQCGCKTESHKLEKK